MIMKLMAEGWLEPFSDDFYDKNIKENYYARGVSPFIEEVFNENKIDGESWSRYAAGYMWGITGIVYNPELVTRDEASTWHIIDNEKFRRQITMTLRRRHFSRCRTISSRLRIMYIHLRLTAVSQT